VPSSSKIRAPHTNKLPEACPYCGSHAISRKGVRKKKLEIVQLWRCASCKRTFTPGPAALRYKTYPIRLVLQALTLYNLGYSLTRQRLRRQELRGVERKLQCTDLLVMRAQSRGADAVVPDFGPDAKKASRTSTTWRPGSGLAW
jgi:transposase-like protein